MNSRLGTMLSLLSLATAFHIGTACAQQRENPELAAPQSSFGSPSTLTLSKELNAPTLTYYSLGDKAVVEGDIVVGTPDELALLRLLAEAGTNFDELTKGLDPEQLDKQPASPERSLRALGLRAVAIKAFFGGRPRRWPGAVIPYELAPGLPGPQRVDQAATILQQKTVLRLVKRTPQNANQYPNYLVFDAEGGGCSSFVGMRGGRQAITIASECSLGNVVHEILHAAGMQHEQTRSDRDKFVRINFDNIIASMRGNFAINKQQNSDIGQYDYASILHYPRWAFAIDPSKDTVTPLQPVEIGQRSEPSAGDINAIAELYK